MCRALSDDGNPTLDKLLAVLAAVGLKISMATVGETATGNGERHAWGDEPVERVLDGTIIVLMAYESIDKLQNVLSETVFHYAKDRKKASGRALGTLVEIVAFYLLKSWGFEQSLAIEKSLPEYGNPEITHNVEYSLHPILAEFDLPLVRESLPINSKHLVREIAASQIDLSRFTVTNNELLSSKELLRNSCCIANSTHTQLMGTLKAQDYLGQRPPIIAIVEQSKKPYAVVECKRVGIEEGMKKGPQTIEKAKQGAYVARAISSLHKVRTHHGELRGLVHRSDGTVLSLPYMEMLNFLIESSDPELLQHFVLSIGVVSNHGNWFTSENHNKELKVLAQSYDWLLFLTDAGLSQFICDLLLEPLDGLGAARDAFLASYTGQKGRNSFTKTRTDYKADRVLENYFAANSEHIKDWFEIISPRDTTVTTLQAQLSTLRAKDWKGVCAL